MKKRVLSLFLVFVMLFSMIPSTAFAVGAEPSQFAGEMVADPDTLDGWQDYFGLRTNAQNESFFSTEYAGAVWSDKSVMTEVPSQFPDSVTLGENNFLVALSALASNSEIVGYSSIPTDTILVLDMSSSMNTAGAIDDLAVAANNAIKALYAENRDNRVGVVYYSGDNDTFVLMPLDRYTSTTGNYLEHYRDRSNNNRNGIRIVPGAVKNSAGQSMTAADTYHSGTFTQDGIYTGMKMLLDAEKTVTEGIQAGRERMPIMVLMTDGEPTHATNEFDGDGTSYDTLDDAQWVSGIQEGSGQQFLTQLTAAYAKYMLENSADRYLEHDLLFYTLGFDVQGTPPVLQPERATSTDSYWNSFLAGRSTTVTDGRVVNGGDDAYDDFITKLNSTAEEDIRASINRNKYRYYVDGYFAASGADSLNTAFQAIVQEIILQSRYSPTLVSGNKNMSGYLTMSDKIGEFMEVKNINGILIGDQLFTGAHLLDMMHNDMFGSSNQFTEAGWELVDVVSERVGIDQAAAIDLLTNAWNAGQLSYTSDTEFSNYLGFYADENGNYLGFYDESFGVEDAPAGAKYITRAYGFYGPTSGSIAGSNMLHIMVRLRTEIETGMQEILFKTPSALIPVVTYNITISGDNLDDPGDISLAHNTEEPIRLLFEVGLDSEINELNVAEKMAAAQYDHDNGDGSYSFYSNRWGSKNGGYVVDYAQPLTHLVTDSQFHPSEENERYYFVENTLVCTDDSGTPYTGTTRPSGDGYYHARRIFKTNQAADGSASMTNIYVPVAAETLELVQRNEDGTWYIPRDTIRKAVARFREVKESNKTGTLEYADYPVVDHPDPGDPTYDIFTFHGNNGKLTVSAATGIKLTKTIDDVNPDPNEAFTFVVSLQEDGMPVSGTFNLTDEQGNVSDLEFVSGTANVTLKHGQTVYITGLSDGMKYTVSEVPHADYQATAAASGTVEQGVLAEVSVVNVKRGTGTLAIAKYLTHPLGSNVQIDKSFTVDVTLRDPLGQPVTDALRVSHSGNGALTSVTPDSQGKFTVTLKAGQTLLVYDLPEGSTATVVETDVPEGFTAYYWENDHYDDGVVTVVRDVATSVTVHNHYTPKEVYPVNIKVDGSKTLDGRDWQEGDSFTFQLQKNENGSWSVVEEWTVSYEDAAKTFSINLAETEEEFTAAGEYAYQVVEVIPAETDRLGGVTYDRTVHNFTVKVTDTDVDGQLEISAVTTGHDHDDGITQDANGWTVHAPFTNTYSVGANASAATSVDIQKQLDNLPASPLVSLSGWKFALYDSLADNANRVGDIVTTDAAGEARFVINYTAADLGSLDSREFTYYIRELAEYVNPLTNVTYSAAAYEVKVLLTHDGAGGLRANVTSVVRVRTNEGAAANDVLSAVQELTFKNIYQPAAVTLPLAVTKKLDVPANLSRPLADGEFTFYLYDTTVTASGGQETLYATGTNKADGTVVFDKALTYDKVGTYTYRLVEEVPADKLPGVTYDSSVYHFHVHVEDVNGVLQATAHVNEETEDKAEFTFTNSYSAAPVSHALGGTKVLQDSEGVKREMAHGMFTFALYEGVTELDRAENSTAGTFTFDAIEYTEPGTYEYTIKELAGTLGYIDYSDVEYTATVVVADEDFDGKLEIKSVTYAAGGSTGDTAAYTNLYTPASTTVQLQAKKVLENRSAVDGEFQFLVYETGSNFAVTNSTPVVRSAENVGSSVTFAGIEYTKPGVHYYVISENAEYNHQSDVSYDATLFRVTVVVYDQGNGQLNRRVTYNNGMVDVETVEFTNVWHPPIPGTLTVKKVFTGLPADRQPSVTALVTGPDNYRRTVTLDEDNDWTAVLDNLVHGEYKVQEVSVDKVSDYVLVDTDTNGTVAFDNTNTAHIVTITNEYESRFGTLTVEKAFSGLESSDLYPAIEATVTGPDGYEEEIVLNAANGWKVELKDLPWGEYTVTEKAGTGAVKDHALVKTEYTSGGKATFTETVTNATVTVTNTYEKRLGTLQVEKVFAGDLPAALRPSVTVNVTGPDGYDKDFVLKAENDWKVSISGLTQGTYTVTEDGESAQVKNYTVVVPAAGEATFSNDVTSATVALTNTYTEAFGSLTVQKVFNSTLPLALRPTIRATVSGPDGYSEDVVLDANNGWSVTLTDLAWGTYTVEEDRSSANVDDYTFESSVSADVTFSATHREATITITNDYTAFGTLTITKAFAGDLPANLRPAEIKVTVTGPNNYRNEVSLTAANNWTAALSGLAVGTYTVTEDLDSAKVANYVVTAAPVDDVEFTNSVTRAAVTLTNTYEERFGTLTVKKEFAGDVPADLPAAITVTVTGPDYEEDFDLTAANGWAVEIDDLAWGEYTVTEKADTADVENYVVTNVAVSGTVEFTADVRSGEITVTNTYDERLGDLTVKKVFAGDVPANLPAVIRATVYGPNGYARPIELKAADNWTVVLRDLPQGLYTVEEDRQSAQVANYVLSSAVSGAVNFTDSYDAGEITLTNTYSERFGDLTVTKVFTGDLPATLRPEAIKVTVTSDKGYSEELELDGDNNWTAVLTDLPQATYTVTEDADSAKLDNYVFTTSVSGTVTFTNDKTEGTVTVTNDYDERFGTLSVKKIFDGDVLPALPEAITVTVSGSTGYQQQFELSQSNNWTLAIGNLPWGVYTVTEDADSADVANYVVSNVAVSGTVEFTADNRSGEITVTNTYDERLGDLTVQKVFAGDLPVSEQPAVTVTVTGPNYEEDFVLDAQNNWTVVIRDLPQGEYKVAEDVTGAEVANYVVTSAVDKSVIFTDSNDADVITVTNTYEERFGDLTVKKVFAGDLPEDLRPAEIKVTVTGPNDYRKELTLIAENDWTEVIRDLPQGEYTVTEDVTGAEVKNYIVSSAVDQKAAFDDDHTEATVTVTNTYTAAFGSLTVEKIFDGDLPEDERPEIHLTVTGPDGYSEDVVLNAANGWKVVLDGLSQGEYKVSEDVENADVKDYILNSSVSAGVVFTNTLQQATITVTNTYTEAFGDLTITKQFVGDLPEKLRPAINATVIGPDGYEQEIVLNAENNWTVTLINLPQGSYSVVEDEQSARVKNYTFKAETGEGVTFTDSLTEATITVINDYHSVPETGDTFNPVLWTGVAAVSVTALVLMVLPARRKKEEQEG